MTVVNIPRRRPTIAEGEAAASREVALLSQQADAALRAAEWDAERLAAAPPLTWFSEIDDD